jgi:hypothetical protein
MTTLEHAFNAKDMNSLVLKIIRGQVNWDLLIFLLAFLNLDATNIKKI